MELFPPSRAENRSDAFSRDHCSNVFVLYPLNFSSYLSFLCVDTVRMCGFASEVIASAACFINLPWPRLVSGSGFLSFVFVFVGPLVLHISDFGRSAKRVLHAHFDPAPLIMNGVAHQVGGAVGGYKSMLVWVYREGMIAMLVSADFQPAVV
ncbi:hypothetical protein BaRGS_00026862 [Batillaria attramentaria]|uniref:Uncharacterized protein n=1 Tax=Batillaria attramentaria TaxID=370345 RepID=A0ABD0K3F0_9CAEN